MVHYHYMIISNIVKIIQIGKKEWLIQTFPNFEVSILEKQEFYISIFIKNPK